MPLGNAMSSATTRTSRSGCTTPIRPGWTSPGGGPAAKSKWGLFTKTLPRPSTTMSLQPRSETAPRSAYGVRVPSVSTVSSAPSWLDTSTGRPSGRKSKHSGSERCSTTTSVVPCSSTATICPPVQSLNHSRPSCHRGDSTSPNPEHRTSMPPSWQSPWSRDGRRATSSTCGATDAVRFPTAYDVEGAAPLRQDAAHAVRPQLRGVRGRCDVPPLARQDGDRVRRPPVLPAHDEPPSAPPRRALRRGDHPVRAECGGGQLRLLDPARDERARHLRQGDRQPRGRV